MTQRHILVALAIAPFLGLIGWFAAGALFAQKAERAREGQAYPLIASSNCRYPSGRCDLRNADMRLALHLDPDGASSPELVLRASHRLDAVLIAIGDSGAETAPQQMRPQDGDGLHWRAPLPDEFPLAAALRLAATAGGSRYFAQTEMTFTQQAR